MANSKILENLKLDIFNLLYKVRRDNIVENRSYKFEIDDCIWAYISDNDAQYNKSISFLAQLMTIVLLESNNRKNESLSFRQYIKDSLKEDTLEDILSDFSESEIREIRIDLEILGFIPPDITKPQWG